MARFEPTLEVTDEQTHTTIVWPLCNHYRMRKWRKRWDRFNNWMKETP